MSKSNAAAPLEAGAPTAHAERSLFGSFTFAYILAAVLVAGLVWYAGTWTFLANTRLLDLGIQTGLVAYHDAQMSLVQKGVPNFADYVKSQEPIKWSLVFLVWFGLYVYWLVKGLQMHVLCRFYGLKGNLGDHAWSYYYGLLYSYFLPYRVGDVAAAQNLHGMGNDHERANGVMRVFHLFVLFEICVFAIVALVGEGWGTWLLQLAWAFVILGVAWLFMRPAPGETARGEGYWQSVATAARELARKPATLVTLLFLSALAFLIEDIAALVTAMAFSGEVVRLHVTFSNLTMGLVAGIIATRIPITPGGIGQFECACAAALRIGGIGMPEAVAISVLFNLLRYAGFLQFYAILIQIPSRPWHESSVDSVLGAVRRPLPVPVRAAEAAA